MEYEIYLQTKRNSEKDKLWQFITRQLILNLNTIPADQRNTRHDEQMDKWCREIAKALDITYYRRDNCLCFCDAELAPN